MRLQLSVTIFWLLLMQCTIVCGQRTSVQKSTSEGRHKNTETVKVSIDTAIVGKPKELKNEISSNAHGLNSSLQSDAGKLKHDSTSRNNIKKKSLEYHHTILEEKASTLQYNSDDPENAPWKKKQFSKDDLQDVNSVSPSTDLNDSKNLPLKIKDNLTGNESFVKEEGLTSNIKKAEELRNPNRVYSDKHIRKIYDSLGINKADSILGIGSALLKSETQKQDLLDMINKPTMNKSWMGLNYDQESGSVNSNDADKIQSLPGQLNNFDISKFSLPTDALSSLPPLSGNMLDAKYLKVIDSMMQVMMSIKKVTLDEKQITDEFKQAAIKRKPSFLDKIYFEGILQFQNDSTLNLIQLSPSWGYKFTRQFSIGAGPNISLQLQEKKINLMAGIRSFTKFEIFRQRAYLQIEDNIQKLPSSAETNAKIDHSILAGGGGLIPISKGLALNLSVLYRINQSESILPMKSPWVFRIGISTIKNLKP